MTKSRIILLRHGEEPKFKDVEGKEKHQLSHEDSLIGLTLQGAARAYYMPRLIKKIIENNKFQLHTYTNYDHIEENGHKCEAPVSRSYFTTQLLQSSPNCSSIVLYNKSQNIYELVRNLEDNIKTHKYIIVCWEHTQIPIIVQKLLNLEHEPNYDNTVKDIGSKLDKIKKKEKYVTNKQLASIVRCANDLKEDNEKIKNEAINLEDDLYYAPVWDLKFNNKKKEIKKII